MDMQVASAVRPFSTWLAGGRGARFLAPGDAESFLINPVDADVETPPLTLLQNWRPDPE
jgi:hypothetical protein